MPYTRINDGLCHPRHFCSVTVLMVRWFLIFNDWSFKLNNPSALKIFIKSVANTFLLKRLGLHLIANKSIYVHWQILQFEENKIVHNIFIGNDRKSIYHLLFGETTKTLTFGLNSFIEDFMRKKPLKTFAALKLMTSIHRITLHILLALDQNTAGLTTVNTDVCKSMKT